MSEYRLHRRTHLRSSSMSIKLLAVNATALGVLIIGTGAFAAALAEPNGAPQDKLPKGSDIVVTGAKPDAAEVRRRAVEYVRSTGLAIGERPAARWIDPVCPRVLGLSDAHAKIVEKELRNVAGATGVPAAQVPCSTNIVISFTQDAGDVVRKIATRSPRRLAEVPQGARAALLNDLSPIRWWYATDVRSRDGTKGTGTMPVFSAGNNEGGGGSIIPDNGNSSTLQQYSSSIVSTQAIRALTSATVIVDVELAEGVSLQAVASYAALVAFAEIRPSAEATSSSILGLFDGGPPSLTKWDTTFLTELYRLPLDRKARQHRGYLINALLAKEAK